MIFSFQTGAVTLQELGANGEFAGRRETFYCPNKRGVTHESGYRKDGPCKGRFILMQFVSKITSLHVTNTSDLNAQLG